jgi:hypothetical protein
MSYGRTAAALILEKEARKNSKHSRKVGSMMSEFYKGLHSVEGIQDKSLFDSFMKMWIAESRRRVLESTLPDNLKELLTNTMVGAFRNSYRTRLAYRDWVSQKQCDILMKANAKHRQDFEKMLKEMT